MADGHHDASRSNSTHRTPASVTPTPHLVAAVVVRLVEEWYDAILVLGRFSL